MDENIAPAPQAENSNHVTTVAEVSNGITSPVVEPTTSDAPVVESETEQAPINEPVAEETNAASERPQPKPAERKIRALVEENKQLRDMLDQPLPLAQNSPPSSKFSDSLQGKESIDPSELDQNVEQYAAQRVEQAVNQKLALVEFKREQEKALDRFEADTEVLSREPELNEDNPETFDKDLFQIIEKRWKREGVIADQSNPQLRALNPRVRLADIAREELEAHRAAVEKGKALASNSLSSLADSISVPQGAESKQEKSFKDMSLKEQEAYLKAKGYDI